MKRPNIVFIPIDDLGWKDIGCYGSSFYETPRLNKLAEEGCFHQRLCRLSRLFAHQGQHPDGQIPGDVITAAWPLPKGPRPATSPWPSGIVL